LNKSFNALLRGYVLFKVNDKIYFSYNKANNSIKNIIGNVDFIGFSIYRLRWLGFYTRRWSIVKATSSENFSVHPH
jgi:hypothetical protein